MNLFSKVMAIAKEIDKNNIVVFIGYCGVDESIWQLENGDFLAKNNIRDVGWKILNTSTGACQDISHLTDYKNWYYPFTMLDYAKILKSRGVLMMPTDEQEALDLVIKTITI